MLKLQCIKDTMFNPSGKQPEWNGKQWVTQDIFYRESDVIKHPVHPGYKKAWMDEYPITLVTKRDHTWSRNVKDGLVIA